jgi:lysophospholipase L1-like esterase
MSFLRFKNLTIGKNKIGTLFLLFVAAVFFIAANKAISHRIFTIGDSTVQDYNAGYAPRKGWGQMFQAFFSSADVQVINKAVGGTSSKSFYNDFWPAVKNELKSGDFVFIQFGINDRNSDPNRSAKGDVFKGYLRNFVNEARAKGAVPVLVSTVRRNAWNTNGTAYDAYHEHPQLVREVAAELDVPLIDLDAKNKAGMEAATEAYVTRYWYNNYVAGEYPNYANGNTDQVHFQEMGAIQLAKYVVQGIQELSNHKDMKKLIPYIKPQYPLTVVANHPEAGLITRTETYPQGLNLHLKALANTGHTFINWKNSSGTLVSTKNIFQVIMPAGPLSYIAYFDDEKFNLDCNGVQNGTATLDNCDRCVGGSTGLSPCNFVMELENGCDFVGVFENTNTGFTGTGYINLDNIIGSSYTFSLNSQNAGTSTVYIRYANGGGADRPVKVLVNGVEVIANANFPVTTDWTTWVYKSLALPLNAGVNYIVFESTTAFGAANLDVIYSEKQGISEGSCVITDIQKLKDLSVTIFPNPFTASLGIQSQHQIGYKLFDLHGKMLYHGQCEGNCELGNTLLPGVYILEIDANGMHSRFKVLKK